MTKPVPTPIDPARLVELALAVVQADRFPDLATMDGDQPRVRPVSPVRTDGFTVYVANLRYHKTQEIAANSRVELCYLDDHHDQPRMPPVEPPLGWPSAAEVGRICNPPAKQGRGAIWDNAQITS